ncbi:beta transducin [Kalmusia sp. IMI 367209]|nr:beta transducin [Kalmusia sp. IMI 367209]
MVPVARDISHGLNKARAVMDTNARVTKGSTVKKVKKRKDGLLNTSISRKSKHLLEFAQRNSVTSPLLRLPPEIRNKIWEYALGGFQIDVRKTGGRKKAVKLVYTTRPVGTCYPLSKDYIKPTFHLHEVCRQMYFETSPLIYTLNTFGFSSVEAMDHWIKNRPTGQLRLVDSIDVPMDYLRLYNHGFRMTFRKEFPCIKRIGVDILLDETLDDSKERILKKMHECEGDDLIVECYRRLNLTIFLFPSLSTIMAPLKLDPEASPQRTGDKLIDLKTRVVEPWTFKKYRNGMLNLRAPARFMKITTANSIDSPLLRLPSEIRNRIFAYAMGGHVITIKVTKTFDIDAFTISHKLCSTSRQRGKRTRDSAAPPWQLPLVCRQLYAETALLPYSLNSFRFVDRNDLVKATGKYKGPHYNVLDLWFEKRRPAQVKAIQFLHVPARYLRKYIERKRPSFQKRFPNIRKVILSSYLRMTYKARIAEIEKGAGPQIKWCKVTPIKANRKTLCSSV